MALSRSRGHAPSATEIADFAAWINDRNIPFLVSSIGMVVMLLWAGSYKMTVPGAEGIVPLVSNSPLISWHFKLFGPYLGSDLIGLTEWAAAILISIGYLKPKAGIIGGLIAAGMFLTTSSNLNRAFRISKDGSAHLLLREPVGQHTRNRQNRS
jgi:uncharacterized membrane protein YkgB